MPMTLTTFDALVDAFFDKCKEVMKTKGADYTKQSDNKLANFERIAAQLNLSPLQIIAIYQGKHRDAIDSYIINSELESGESLEMRFVDDINYGLLMLAQAIAEGYKPREDWLKFALNTKAKLVGGETDFGGPGRSTAPSGPPMRVVDVPGGRQVCCNPDGDNCCDGEAEDDGS